MINRIVGWLRSHGLPDRSEMRANDLSGAKATSHRLRLNGIALPTCCANTSLPLKVPNQSNTAATLYTDGTAPLSKKEATNCLDAGSLELSTGAAASLRSNASRNNGGSAGRARCCRSQNVATSPKYCNMELPVGTPAACSR